MMLYWHVKSLERRMDLSMSVDNTMKIEYLNRIDSPVDLKKIERDDIDKLCEEIRGCIISTTEKNGGHLASNLGVVELTVAIHRVFDCPKDHIIFDVGHQSYTHKLLTGRYKNFDSLRRAGGLSGFTNRSESEYDCFGAGHSSTSLSSALGFAESDRLSGSDAYTVVVLGDGAFTGGMIHEALNNCNKNLSRLIIIINENEMSISKNIGRFAGTLARIRKKTGYIKAKRATVSILKKVPLVGNLLFRAMRAVKKSVKNALYGSNYFEDMGLYYLGPADGNDYDSVESLLTAAKSAGENVVVHLKTQKGKGYEPAELDPGKYHGVSPNTKADTPVTFSSVMGDELCTIAEQDPDVCAITAAMSSGTGLDSFANKYKDRFFDVGIAEEHAVTFAAGLASNGKKPVFAVYSTFLQRSYDQMIHDVALQKLPVVFCVDRAGFNNSDGATHHGIFDVAFTSQIPNFKIYSPVTYDGVRRSLRTALRDSLPSTIRYPSGCECEEIVKTFYADDDYDEIGIKRDFDGDVECLIITHGRIAAECIKAKKILKESGIRVGIILCEYIAPYDMLTKDIADVICDSKPDTVCFVEEEIKAGGFGMMLSDQLKQHSCSDGIRFGILAAENAFTERKSGENYLEASGLDSTSIAERIKKIR